MLRLFTCALLTILSSSAAYAQAQQHVEWKYNSASSSGGYYFICYQQGQEIINYPEVSDLNLGYVNGTLTMARFKTPNDAFKWVEVSTHTASCHFGTKK